MYRASAKKLFYFYADLNQSSAFRCSFVKILIKSSWAQSRPSLSGRYECLDIVHFIFTRVSLLLYTVNQHIVVAPQCLIKNLDVSYKTLSSLNSISLLQVDDKGIEKLIAAKENTKTPCGGFMDVSQAWKEFNINNKSAKLFLQHYAQSNKKTSSTGRFVRNDKNEAIIKQLLGQINPQRMWDDLTTLSSMRDVWNSIR